MRVGSVVAKISLQPTPRPYIDHRAYCLYFANGTCGKCIDRCPVGAITQGGSRQGEVPAALGLRPEARQKNL